MDKSRQSKVPSGRISRLLHLGELASKVAGNVALHGARQLASGNRPQLKDLLLTPANIERVGLQLAQMRGAAMKMGQLMSMDTGDILPPELTALLVHLRDNAQTMPIKQLKQVLVDEWGEDWESRFMIFNLAPFAAASIGQVHKATTIEGRLVAVKVQYPGIKRSINSDIDNVATLLNLSGLLPSHLDIKPLLSEAKAQLHDEADYRKELEYMQAYRACLKDEDSFVIPEPDLSLCTEHMLAMDFVEGQPIETLVDVPQAQRNASMTHLIRLLLRELFEFHLVQSDPNFANYLYQPDSGNIVLLDFGAVRRFPEPLANSYLAMLRAALASDREATEKAARAIGLIGPDASGPHVEKVLDILFTAIEPIVYDGEYDFAASDLALRVHNLSLELQDTKHQWHTPPADVLFAHRKVGGLFLLASRVKAKINVRALLTPYL